MSVLDLVTLYFQMGVLGGGIFYALRPLHRTLPGVFFVGCLSAALVVFTLTFSVLADVTRFWERVQISVIGAVVAGPALALLQWWHDERHRKTGAA